MFTENAASGNCTLQMGVESRQSEMKAVYALEKNIQFYVNWNVNLNCRRTE